MTVELLYLPGCPNHEATAKLVQSVLRAESMPAEFQEIAIRDYAEATAHIFPGSPTIRVNGQDIENVSPRQLDVGFACRTYVVDGKHQGVPPRSWLEQAIRTAANQENRQ